MDLPNNVTVQFSAQYFHANAGFVYIVGLVAIKNLVLKNVLKEKCFPFLRRGKSLDNEKTKEWPRIKILIVSLEKSSVSADFAQGKMQHTVQCNISLFFWH